MERRMRIRINQSDFYQTFYCLRETLQRIINHVIITEIAKTAQQQHCVAIPTILIFIVRPKTA